MDRSNNVRNGVVVFIIFLVAAIYSIRLFSLQLTETDENAYSNASTTTYIQYVPAARGEILDRHGTVLVSNRATYYVTLQSFVLYNSDDPNGYLLSLAETCIKNGIEYEESLPLSMSTPYTYTMDELSSQEQYNFRKFLLGREWDADMTAENLAKLMKKSYHISDEYTEYEARLIMGLRYELDLPSYAYTDTYTVVEDVSAENLAILKELGIPGMDVGTTTVREFNTTFGAQILGHVGLMTEEEYENTYKALDYSMDASVGKDGFEEAFEEYLHGTDGQKVVTVTSDGTVVDEYWEVEPKSGANVITTIDIGMQELAESSLAKWIQAMADGKEEGQGGYDASTGAVVVMDPNTFEVWAAANYPTYDPSDYATKYDELLTAQDSPLSNRALMFAFAPGSTFKMITSIAAMRYGISPDETVDGNGLYTKYEEDGYTPKCWIYPGTHGTVNMTQALAQSCNIYFYTMGDRMGIRPINRVATSFGFGQPTGCELIEETGRMASIELKEQLYEGIDAGWYAADSLMAAIGQSITTATPLQLCRYVATLANGGTLYNATFFRRAVSSDFQTLVKENSFSPVATDLMDASEYAIIKEGMRMCVTEGTAQKYMENYPIEVCAKTGTAQHGTGGSDNAAFVCWAPADNPEIAIAVYVEHGDTGGWYSYVAMDIMDYYFGTKNVAQEVHQENVTLIEQ